MYGKTVVLTKEHNVAIDMYCNTFSDELLYISAKRYTGSLYVFFDKEKGHDIFLICRDALEESYFWKELENLTERVVCLMFFEGPYHFNNCIYSPKEDLVENSFYPIMDMILARGLISLDYLDLKTFVRSHICCFELFYGTVETLVGDALKFVRAKGKGERGCMLHFFGNIDLTDAWELANIFSGEGEDMLIGMLPREGSDDSRNVRITLLYK